MARLEWDKTSERKYKTGTNKGVHYPYDASKTGEGEHVYGGGVAWPGLTGVTESPSGGEPTKLWADNMNYLSMYSAEELGFTINAYYYPDEFEECDGSAGVQILAQAFSTSSTYAVGDVVSYNGANYKCKTAIETAGQWDSTKWTLMPSVAPMKIGQQARKSFGFCYRTAIGNDTDGEDYGYELHLLYGCKASPSERSFETINDSPNAITFSWTCTTTPIPCTINGVEYKPTAIITIDSTKCSAAGLKALEDALYGTEQSDPYLPLPAEVYALLSTTEQTQGGEG